MEYEIDERTGRVSASQYAIGIIPSGLLSGPPEAKLLTATKLAQAEGTIVNAARDMGNDKVGTALGFGAGFSEGFANKSGGPIMSDSGTKAFGLGYTVGYFIGTGLSNILGF